MDRALNQAERAPVETSGPHDVMIDIETLGTAPGSVILSIGAVMFGAAGLGETFYAPVLLQSCVDAGLAIDPNTVAWWMNQSDDARTAAFRADAERLPVVLLAFSDWLATHAAERPWCHGATFDVPLLDAAYKACGLPSPWKFFSVRDTRTLYDLAGVKPDRTKGMHHNALDDAINQAEAAVEAMRRLTHYMPAEAATSSPTPAEATVLTDERSLPTDLSKRLRKAATAEVSYADARLLIGAAEEIERYYGGMMNWKATAQANDKTIIDLRTALKMANERLAESTVAPTIPAQAPAEEVRDQALIEASEGIEIIDNLIDSIERHGNYSQDTTVGFLNQALQCFAPIRALAHQSTANSGDSSDLGKGVEA